jgi:arsenate reductase
MAQENRIFNVLFLCTHNSARSIMAEALLNNLATGKGRFKGYSAGSFPATAPNPLALEQIRRAGMPTQALRSKNWDEFALPDAPKLDFVFTVCDNTAKEACPVWPGQPMTAHWGMPDPSQVAGNEEAKQKAFAQSFRALANRIQLFASLPIDKLDRLALQKKLDAIGKDNI